MRYCIGCKHLRYEPADDGYYYSSWTNSPGTPAELACQKGKWQGRFDEDFTRAAFEAAMASAKDCPDYEERVID